MPDTERLIRSLARRYANWRVPAEDLEQEGRIAAWQAGQTYQPNRGRTLCTYRILAARCAMLNYLVSPRSNLCERAPLSIEGLVREPGRRDFAPMLIDVLSQQSRELEMLRLVTSEELSYREAAQRLGVSVALVNKTLTALYHRWGVHSIVQAYNEAMRRGLIEPPKRKED